MTVNMATRPNWKRCRRPVGHCDGGRGLGAGHTCRAWAWAGEAAGPGKPPGEERYWGGTAGVVPSGQALWDDGGGRSRAGAGSGGLTGRDGRGRICIGLSFGTGRCG